MCGGGWGKSVATRLVTLNRKQYQDIDNPISITRARQQPPVTVSTHRIPAACVAACGDRCELSGGLLRAA
eukprot:1395368-Amorphochlora_amoeboformis.AAC.2